MEQPPPHIHRLPPPLSKLACILSGKKSFSSSVCVSAISFFWPSIPPSLHPKIPLRSAIPPSPLPSVWTRLAPGNKQRRVCVRGGRDGVSLSAGDNASAGSTPSEAPSLHSLFVPLWSTIFHSLSLRHTTLQIGIPPSVCSISHNGQCSRTLILVSRSRRKILLLWTNKPTRSAAMFVFIWPRFKKNNSQQNYSVHCKKQTTQNRDNALVPLVRSQADQYNAVALDHKWYQS